MSNNNSNEPESHEKQDPQITLAHHLGELKNLKKSNDSHAIFAVSVELRDYSEKLDLSYSKMHLFFNDIQYLVRTSYRSNADKLLHKDNPEILQMDKEDLEKAIDNVTYHLDSLIRSPTKPKLKVVPIKNKKGIFDFLRKGKILKIKLEPKLKQPLLNFHPNLMIFSSVMRLKTKKLSHDH